MEVLTLVAMAAVVILSLTISWRMMKAFENISESMFSISQSLRGKTNSLFDKDSERQP